MQKRDFETYQKRFRDFEILLKFSETHVFRGTIRHPWNSLRQSNKYIRTVPKGAALSHESIAGLSALD